MLGEEAAAGDKFEISATTTVREAKDLVLRLERSRRWGLEIRRDNNMVEDLVPGLRWKS